jgi:molecular chaperone DnaJ
MEDLFSSLFGGSVGGRARTSTRGDDLEASISISFMEGAKGTTKTINIMPVADCETCSGNGLKPGIKRTQCKTCYGTGTQTFVLNSGFQMASPCQACQGTGASIPRGGECDDCGGLGKIKYKKPIKVDVPAGELSRSRDCLAVWIANLGRTHSFRLFD